MSMNIERHVKAHRELHDHLANGEHEKAQATKAFYDEYFAVLDLSAEFYLETVRLIFQDYALPTGRLEWRGRRVEPRAIKRTMLLTVEGERDDIARSARPPLRMSCARGCGLISSATIRRQASGTTACSAATAGQTRLIRWCVTSSSRASRRAMALRGRALMPACVAEGSRFAGNAVD